MERVSDGKCFGWMESVSLFVSFSQKGSSLIIYYCGGMESDSLI